MKYLGRIVVGRSKQLETSYKRTDGAGAFHGRLLRTRILQFRSWFAKSGFLIREFNERKYRKIDYNYAKERREI